ncbi:site-specific recombinase XerD [Thermocatellispora tengchongensis]|uniref:Site-specific recombinase XerD n=1 Tax=Thermocatellispora tengchongensis TaxID=1073253 RepID=A0A840PQB5_9ACTN|nr:tyrosine-type recombinase/integrase [Thermocatellispora tengchongensis]MBB5139961.1 site-specific recombinase XerD [Thermocatellispora tengchongensis]
MTDELVEAPRGDLALPLDLPPLVVEITQMWLETRRSPNTREAYRRAIRLWFSYCERTGLDPLEMSVRHAELYARWMVESADRTPTPKTIAQRMSAVSAWYKYLIKNDAARFNPFAEADRPTIPRRHSETTALTEDEAHTLVQAADKDHGRERLRTAALIRMLVQVGLRITEAVGAEIDDLGFSRGYRTLRLTLKGGKPHFRKLPVETVYALDQYLEERASRAGVELRDLHGPLFATGSGRPLPREKAWELVQRIARQAGITSKVTPHTLRHTWASIAEARGAKPREIQEALGHESFETTLIYLHSRDQLEKDPSQLVASAVE